MRTLSAITSVVVVISASAVADVRPLPRLSFEARPNSPDSERTSPIAVQNGFVIDRSYMPPQVYASRTSAITELQSAIEHMATTQNLHWNLNREIYGYDGTNPLTATPSLLRHEHVPITPLPSPKHVLDLLPAPQHVPDLLSDEAITERDWRRSERVHWIPDSVMPSRVSGVNGRTEYIPSIRMLTIPRMQGVERSKLPTIVGIRLGRIVSRHAEVHAAKSGHFYDRIAGASTLLITRAIWYFEVSIPNPNADHNERDRKNPMEGATQSGDWCFPIMDANGQARPSDDSREAERTSPLENRVTTALIPFHPNIPGQQVPLVLPTAWDNWYDTNSPEFIEGESGYEGTETIVLPQRLIEAAAGVVIVRKASSWRPLAQDIIIDADTKNTKDILGVYISQIVSDERLIDALCELCGQQPPTGEARAKLIQEVAETRTQR